ncbi:MAG: Hsp20/alpha crystallin family protein [Verrucomicrobiota bacterium]
MTTELCQSNSCETVKPQRESYVRPQYTVKEGADAYEVGVVMPGVPRDGVDVELDKNELTIIGHVHRDVPESWKVLHEELSKSDYRLQLQLKFEFDGDGITAKVEDGVLSLRLPVSEAAKPKQIQIA